MKLTPLDIRKQEFKKTLRGFDPIEVQTFLEMVAEEFEQIQEENKQMNRKVVELETKLNDYQETEKNLRETLLNVQEVKKQSEESSRRQADLIIKEAELKALEIVETARKQARQMRDDVNMLRNQKESFINRLRQILISQIELLSVLEMDDAIPEEAQLYVEKTKARKKSALKNRLEKLKTEQEEPGVDDANDAAIELVEEVDFGDTVQEDSGSEETGDSTGNVGADSDEPRDTQQKTDKKEKVDDEDINEFFKKGIQIDELIKNLEKKRDK